MFSRRSPSRAAAPLACHPGRRRRTRRRGGAALAVLAGAALALGAGCAPTPRAADGADAAPHAEFLLAAGDSTYWVRSGARGVQVRAAPLVLARWDGRFYEVYTSDDDWSYPDALFAAQRVWRRDLVSGDSALVLDDSTVAGLAREYAAAHPDAEPLEPDAELDERPASSATTEVALVEVHGPYLTVERRADVDVAGRPHRHQAVRTVLDLRTGRPASLAALFGDSAAAALARAGRGALRSARDSVRALAAVESDSVRERALAAIATVRFDAASFGLGDVAGEPAVQFVATATDDDGGALLLPLPPLAAPARDWWADVRRALPSVTPGGSEDVWRGTDGLDVVARYDVDGPAALLLRARPAPARGAAPADARMARRREWALARVAPPARQLVALDRPPLDSAARRALARAFDESSLYGDEVVLVAHPRGAAAPRAPRRLRRPFAAPHPRTDE